MGDCMKIEISAAMLNAALKTLKPVVGHSLTIPILGAVKFAGGRLTVTDLDRELSVSVAALEFLGEGCLPFAPLMRLVAALSRSYVEGRHNDDSLTIRIGEGGRVAELVSRFGRYRLPVFSPSDFPHLEMPADAARVAIDGDRFARALAFAAPFASREETRYYLNGVCLYGRDVVATDGHRMAVWRNANAHEFKELILPHGAVSVLTSMPALDSLSHSVSLGSPRIMAESAGLRLVAKTIDCAFPNFNKVIPACDRWCELPRADVLGTCRRLSRIVDGRAREVALAGNGERLALAVRGMDGEGGEELIEVSGDAVSVAFNGQYLDAVLRMADGEIVSMGWRGENGPGSPHVFRADDAERMLVLMPMCGESGAVDAAKAALADLDERKVAV